ncbi:MULTISPECIES: putative phage abortive infection protein [Bacillus cereus group]|uniref:putative phage abortive infection protein n=1 Tax=Bacillus cereus group TaxID=86661 RepID=UPI0020D26D0F|nr:MULTISPECIES: putative phage abortive infection protein [Bacillus cereus group]
MRKIGIKFKESFSDLVTMLLVLVGVVLFVVATKMPFKMYDYFVPKIVEYKDIRDLGPVGDFIGGTTVAFLTAASTVFLLATIIMQRKEIRATLKQAEEAKKETQITNETMKKQQFETTFFNMLSLHHQIVKDIRISVPYKRCKDDKVVRETEVYSGRAAIVELKGILEDKLGKADYLFQNSQENENVWGFVDREKWKKQLFATTNRISEELLNNVYEDFHDEYGNAIGHYMRNNYRIVKFIVENVVDDKEEQKRIKTEEKRDTIVGDKRFYFGTLRAQWSNAEFELIFINSLYEKNSKFKDFIKQHDVLDIKETDEEKLKNKPVGSFILKEDTIIPVSYKHLIEND